MKKEFILTFLLLLSFNCFSDFIEGPTLFHRPEKFDNVTLKNQNPIIHSGKFDSKNNTIILNLSYGGGCGMHKFYLNYENKKINHSTDALYLQLIQLSADYCKAFVHKPEVNFETQDDIISYSPNIYVYTNDIEKAVKIDLE